MSELPTNLPEPPHEWLQLVRKMVAGLSFGEVLVTVHEGRVVQIEHREKVRLQSAPRPRTERKANL